MHRRFERSIALAAVVAAIGFPSGVAVSVRAQVVSRHLRQPGPWSRRRWSSQTWLQPIRS